MAGMIMEDNRTDIVKLNEQVANKIWGYCRTAHLHSPLDSERHCIKVAALLHLSTTGSESILKTLTETLAGTRKDLSSTKDELRKYRSNLHKAKQQVRQVKRERDKLKSRLEHLLEPKGKKQVDKLIEEVDDLIPVSPSHASITAQ